MNASGSLFIISAPSGGGKTSLVSALIQKMAGLRISVSHTTRAPRRGEEDGKNYFFVNNEDFENYHQQGLFLEHAKVFNHWYGTSRTWVLEQLAMGIDVILEIDWQGARKVKALMDCISIFIIPPSRAILLSRLQSRNQDSQVIIQERMSQASDEISHYAEYDYLVINDDFNAALEDLMAIVRAQRLRCKRQKHQYEELLASLI